MVKNLGLELQARQRLKAAPQIEAFYFKLNINKFHDYQPLCDCSELKKALRIPCELCTLREQHPQLGIIIHINIKETKITRSTALCITSYANQDELPPLEAIHNIEKLLQTALKREDRQINELFPAAN